MTVILNEAALVALLDTQEGPVGQHVQRLAAAVEIQAQNNLKAYFIGAPSVDVDRDVAVEMDGSTAVIGIRDAGNKSRRMAQYQAEGRVNWLTGALDLSRF